jgi:hypothetical protein
MMLSRKPTIEEERLLELLINKSITPIQKNWKEGLLVRSMDDGEMGSLRLYPNGEINKDLIFGKQVSELQFIDLDSVNVIASLNLDNFGNLFELDIWKTDFSKLIRLPKIE